MSVLKNKRKLAKFEYENTFDIIYHHLGKKMCCVPKRLRMWINTPINTRLNEIYLLIMELRTNFFKSDTKDERQLELINTIIDKIIAMQPYLYAFWNVMDYDTDKIIGWCDEFNNELALLRGVAKRNPLYKEDKFKDGRRIMYYRKIDIQKADFLNGMSKLHDYTIRKIAHAKNIYNDRECAMIAECMDNAWYYCLEANMYIPTTKKQYERREEKLSNAISNLKKAEPPLVSLFNLMGYSESILREWTVMFNTTLTKIYALKKSDRKRFGDLK
jgi:hypothetical protein